MLSQNLAILYEVTPKVLIQAVKRNIKRFPDDFMFQLTWEEVESLQDRGLISELFLLKESRSQIVTLKKGHNIKY